MSETKKDVEARANGRGGFEGEAEPVNGRARKDPRKAEAEAQGPAENAHAQVQNEPGAPEYASSAPPPPPEDPQVTQLQSELDAARRRVDELARAYQALNQDREEFKQRLNRERERMIDVEKGKVSQALLEAIDELDRCLQSSAQDDSPLAQGVRLIRGNLLSKALASGLERLVVVGKPFDPNLAEAVDMEITTDPERDQEVVSEITAGYRMKDRVVRAARVKVAKYVKPADA